MTLVKDEAVLNEGLVGDEEANARDNIGRYLRNSSVIIDGGRKLKDEGVEWWGLMEFQTRVCGNERKFRVGTVGMLVKEGDKDVEIDGVGMLEMGKKWLVVKDDGTRRVCLYEGKKGVDEEVPVPKNSATPSPAVVKIPGESPEVSVDGTGAVIGEGDEAEASGSGSPDAEDGDGSESESESDDGVCFPGDVEVEIQGGGVKLMKDVVVGDKVRVGQQEFSDVFMFTHKIDNGQFEFVKIDTDFGKTLYLSKGHYLYVNGRLASAETVVIGDDLQLGNGMMTQVVALSCEHRQGLYNPQTMHGDIVVNGVLASTYTTAVEPSVAHKLLTPVRFIYSFFGIASSALENGGGFLTRFMPKGSSIVA